MDKYRIIYSGESEKNIYEYNLLKNIIKDTELFVYNGLNDNYKELNKVKYNVYIDAIPEDAYLNIPCEITILIVNDKYVKENKDIYLRREYYKDLPFIKIIDVVNCYWCLTLYSYNIISKIIKKNKNSDKPMVKYLDLFNNVNFKKENIKKSKKYILYNVDIYSNIQNIILLKTWEKYFLNSDKILIIKYMYRREHIVKYFSQISKQKISFFIDTYKYKNIILTNDNIDIYYSDVGCCIINSSYYNLIFELYNAFINNKCIITEKNKISKDLLKKNAIYFNKFNEIELKRCLDEYIQ